MGNRAVITTKENFENNGIGIYMHWNGGRDSVEAFLAFCKARGYRPPDKDNYGWAYLATTIGNVMEDGLSVGVDTVNNLDCDNWDNGVYFIEDWEIVGRKYNHGEQNIHDFYDVLEMINEHQPEKMRLSDDELHSIPLRPFYMEKSYESDLV